MRNNGIYVGMTFLRGMSNEKRARFTVREPFNYCEGTKKKKTVFNAVTVCDDRLENRSFPSLPLTTMSTSSVTLILPFLCQPVTVRVLFLPLNLWPHIGQSLGWRALCAQIGGFSNTDFVIFWPFPIVWRFNKNVCKK